MSKECKVALAVVTFKRPENLEGLLPRLIDQGSEVSAELGCDFVVLVVDNDPLGSAREMARAVGDGRIRYVVEHSPGISSARNRALKEAEDCDYLVFIDDDEIPHERWLVTMMTTMNSVDADVVAGPVRTVSEAPLDAWIAASGAHLRLHRSHLRTGDAISRAATNNLLLNLETVRHLGVTFDQRFGLTGGEDSFFTGQLHQRGAAMVWCAEAVVDDILAPSRNTRDYNLRRRFSLSNAGGRVEVLLVNGKHRALVRLKCMARGVGQVVFGASLVLRGLVGRSLGLRARGERYVLGGFGVLAAGLGISVSPYRRKKPQRA